MLDYFPSDSFAAAWHECQEYPSSGTREANFGVPSRPTLARYSTIQVLGYDPFGSPLRSVTKPVLACMTCLASDPDRKTTEIIDRATDKSALRQKAQQAVFKAYPNAKRTLPENTFSSPNFAFSTLTALCAVSYDVDPIEAVQKHLGEADYRS